MLYIVSTPIGNLDDFTFRGIKSLQSVDLIAAEDTRRTGILLKHYNIKKKLISYNDHNKMRRIPHLINQLNDGAEIALVSDAGTPGISDPGYHLINAAIDADIKVIPIPGANAAISALVCSGLPTDKFEFRGFLPKKEGKKRSELLRSGTLVFYESPHRIHKTLDMLAKISPQAKICIGRELTKKFEEFLRGTPSEVIEKIGTRKLKGEIVLVVYG